jgi:hypothetical protein
MIRKESLRRQNRLKQYSGNLTCVQRPETMETKWRLRVSRHLNFAGAWQPETKQAEQGSR